MHPRFVAVPIALALLSACATTSPKSAQLSTLARVSRDLKLGRRATLPAEQRAGFYLDAAALTSRDPDNLRSTAIYNSAAAELTDLLRHADGGRLWNRPLETSANGTPYRLQFTRPQEAWALNSFTDFKLASQVKRRHLRSSVTQPGIGGTLVGISKTPHFQPGERAPFEPKAGFLAPVTATLDFRGTQAALALRDPAKTPDVHLNGQMVTLAADFTAPIAFAPVQNELWHGLMAMVQVEKYLSTTGLYMLQPYDPKRIPVVLVHGLASTSQMWANTINEIERDPHLRGRFQFWVFNYPTGTPVVYSAMRCREELARMHKLHPMHHGFIMIGHSLGGLVSQMQAIDTGRAFWDANLGRRADALYLKLPPGHLVKRALIFHHNPRLKRLVFICVPHRGSDLAIGSIGAISMRFITLPTTLVKTVRDALGDVLLTVGGKTTLPTSITSLSPRSPTLRAMDKMPIRAPYHSIIGDRGKGNTPNSSDGAVLYRSSHLEGARSELIVPGPHSSYELPPTINEISRILHQHLH